MVIFDFDGTIADTMDEALRIVNRLAPDYGFPVIDEDLVKELRDLRTREVVARVGIKPRLVPKLIVELKAELRKRIHLINPVPDVPENLRILKDRGVRMGILTSNSRSNVEVFLANCGLTDYFTFLDTGSPIFGKARLLRKILERESKEGTSARDHTIYVGDETRDITAARRVGIRAAAVCWGANTRRALEAMRPDFLLERPSELSGIIP